MQRLTAATLAVALLAGCATAPPGTPGAGRGETYTPFVDMQGLDTARYAHDMEGCRTYARQIDPGREAMAGMIAGMLIGAAIGAAVGGNSWQAQNGAAYGGGVGLGRGVRAENSQQTIIANCMAGRGYRVLYGATQPTNTAAPSPYLQTSAPMGAPAAAAAAPAPPAAQAPNNVVPGCGWVGNTWKCNR